MKIRVFKGTEPEPETPVTVRGSVLKIASKLIPGRATEVLQEKGIDLEEVVRLSGNPDAHGILVEVVDHKKNERVVVAFE